MARQNNPQISTRKDAVTTIMDINGNVILEIGQHEYSIRHSDGSRTHRQISKTIETVDGTIWGPLSKLPVGICTQCRQPSLFHKETHGIVVRRLAKICEDGCGQLLCPRHARKGRDGKWRCIRHHNQHLLKNVLRPIFFKQEEE